jgi:hypothetical protein
MVFPCNVNGKRLQNACVARFLKVGFLKVGFLKKLYKRKGTLLGFPKTGGCSVKGPKIPPGSLDASIGSPSPLGVIVTGLNVIQPNKNWGFSFIK